MKLKRFAAALLALVLLAFSAGTPALAEGFSYDWDQDGDNPDGPHCKSLALYNLDTDTMAYVMNADEPLPMASMTKIMTYIVAWETVPDLENAVITVPESVDEELAGTFSSVADIYPGESYTGWDLLHLMMIPSGNNAALVLAKYVDDLHDRGLLKEEQIVTSAAGEEEASSSEDEPADAAPDSDSSQESQQEESQQDWDSEFSAADYTGRSYFVELMNRKAEELGCTNTHFTNPHGLHDPEHYASARDMVTIAKYAMGLPGFTEITGTASYTYHPIEDPNDVRTADTTNYLMVNFEEYNSGVRYYYQSATGIKTGSHDEAGYCITASATAFGYTYIAVAMGSPYVDEDGYRVWLHGEMLDVRSLFRWALSSLEKKTVAVQGDVLSSVKLKYAWQKDELQLTAGENVSVMLPDTVEDSSIVFTPDIPEFVEAPIRRGEEIGTAQISYAGDVIATVPLVAAESVAKSEALEVWEQGQAVLRAPWFLVIMGVIIALIVVYIILILLYRRKQRQLRKVRRFRDF